MFENVRILLLLSLGRTPPGLLVLFLFVRLFKIYFCCVHVCVCGNVWCMPEEVREDVGSPELEFQAAVSSLMWVLGTEFGPLQEQ